MARPKVPLISKREVLLVALRIIDEEGIDALSIRRLAAEFNVNGASFYHHFHNKDEILAGAAELALDNVRVPSDRGSDWQRWILRNAQLLRKALLAHPHLIMVMLRLGRPRIGRRQVEATIERLEQHGVPAEQTLALLEALERFAIGSALAESHESTKAEVPAEIRDTYPNLYGALQRRVVSHDKEFALGCSGIIEAFAAAREMKSDRRRRVRRG